MINTTTVTLSGWTVQFALAANMSASGVNGAVTRNGAIGTFTPAVWFTNIGPGGQATVGFSGGGSPFSPPNGFTLNGTPCTAV